MQQKGNHLVGSNSPYLLEHAHNPVDWYPWGEEALAKAVYDCILCDHKLPGGDGLDIVLRVRETQSTTPIIVLTGQGDEALAVELLKAGAADYIPKSSLSSCCARTEAL